MANAKAGKKAKGSKGSKAAAGRSRKAAPRRVWKGGRLTQSTLDAVAGGAGRVDGPAPKKARKLAPGAAGVRGDGKPLELPSGGPVAAPARASRMLSDPRLPAVGAVIVKTYKGRELRVIRLADRFEFEGRDYPSLSRIAREVIGGEQINGFAFFGLTKPSKEKPADGTAAPSA